jgi:hypothetical protein
MYKARDPGNFSRGEIIRDPFQDLKKSSRRSGYNEILCHGDTLDISNRIFIKLSRDLLVIFKHNFIICGIEMRICGIE